MQELLAGLRAAGEPTRLRLLALCAHAELTVTELTQILRQSQPRVSRHLKLLCDAGLLRRFREGQWAFYRMADGPDAGLLARSIADMMPVDDPGLARDLERLEEVRAERAEAAARYFRDNAARWDEIRSLYVPEQEVERTIAALLQDVPVSDLLDVGTGTGRILEVLAPSIERGTGIDLSHEMLAVARANLGKSGLQHLQVRHGDMYDLPLDDESMDAVVFHQVLRYAEEPTAAIAEAGRVLRSHGMILIVDFAPHSLEFLRAEHAHRRLGLSNEEVQSWCDAAGLECSLAAALEGDPLTVNVWRASHTREGAGTASRSATGAAAR